ncbi:hypothetical protein ACFORG_18840 [Lutimaribacter marinistellae]|uniref:C-type lysozyme inhibitor domain-containing protein n=1 Tax=Lutimaribacter marinistellae TaxID=1820329 RepID=A0ABV7TLJ3_9RHOB
MMKNTLLFATIGVALAAGPALAQSACPWAGGQYEFKEHGIYGDFTVNADCSQMTWSRLSDEPETSAMVRSKNGWEGSLDKADFELLDDGTHLRITGNGGAMRQTRAKRVN